MHSHHQAGPRLGVQIGSLRSVVIGQGEAGVTVRAGAVAEWRGPCRAVAIAAPAAGVVIGGKQGIAGPPGPGAEIEIYRAAVALGGHRAVGLNGNGELIYADSVAGIPSIGVIRDAVAAGAEVAVYRAGRVGGFTSLTPTAPYYLAATGLLTLTAPTSGVLQPVGLAASATELLVDPDYPTFL